jgi:hypothetical protein
VFGEGSPRHSGEENHAFLQTSRAAGPSQQADPGPSRQAASAGGSRGPADVGSRSSKGSSSNNSGYGVLIDRPTLNLQPSTREELDQLRRGQILTPEELRHVDGEPVSSQNIDGRYTPLSPPPRLVDPELVGAPHVNRPSFKPRLSHLSQLSTIPDADEPATVAMARRVRAEDLASRSPPQLPLPLSDPNSNRGSGFIGGLGVGLAGLGRWNWFKSLESNSRRNSRMSPLNNDADVRKSLLDPQMSEITPTQNLSLRGLTFGMGHDGNKSDTTSNRNRTTVYHDASSSSPTTPT